MINHVLDKSQELNCLQRVQTRVIRCRQKYLNEDIIIPSVYFRGEQIQPNLIFDNNGGVCELRPSYYADLENGVYNYLQMYNAEFPHKQKMIEKLKRDVSVLEACNDFLEKNSKSFRNFRKTLTHDRVMYLSQVIENEDLKQIEVYMKTEFESVNF